MHMCYELWLPKKPVDVEATVDRLMGPHHEENRKGRQLYDWYQIGGRWVNNHEPSYDPAKDPKNHEKGKKCDHCKGTGVRDEGRFELKSIGTKPIEGGEPTKNCDQCGGTGNKVKWPTQWVTPKFVLMEQDKIPATATCYAVIIAGPRGVRDVVGFNDDKPIVEFLKENELKGGWLVTLDAHQ